MNDTEEFSKVRRRKPRTRSGAQISKERENDHSSAAQIDMRNPQVRQKKSQSLIQFSVSKGTIQGRRPYQEDRLLAVSDLFKLATDGQTQAIESLLQKRPKRLSLFAVVDGHAGARAAQFAIDHVCAQFWIAIEQMHLEDPQKPIVNVIGKALDSVIKEIDHLFLEKIYCGALTPNLAVSIVLPKKNR